MGKGGGAGRGSAGSGGKGGGDWPSTMGNPSVAEGMVSSSDALSEPAPALHEPAARFASAVFGAFGPGVSTGYLRRVPTVGRERGGDRWRRRRWRAGPELARRPSSAEIARGAPARRLARARRSAIDVGTNRLERTAPVLRDLAPASTTAFAPGRSPFASRGCRGTPSRRRLPSRPRP